MAAQKAAVLTSRMLGLKTEISINILFLLIKRVMGMDSTKVKRSTLCSVMAQLTEDIQPSFDTTLKSKAVSENCNVKFSCVVSGYPAPELKWYKDDLEMDRCTLDDAAIYQVSASNSKGIVSCSGVLEVGTMSEFKIHQRFFAKLKQKAEKKKSELEMQNKKEDKENIQKEEPQSSPERPQRKRPVPPPKEKPVVKEPEAVEQLGAAMQPNGVSSEVKETALVTSKDSELEKEVSPSEEATTKKKIKISNGVDAVVNTSSSRGHMMENGGENCYDGGISLAQFLAEALQSQAAEEKQNSSRGEKPKEMDTNTVSASKEKEREQERMQKEREEQEKAREAEYERETRREEKLAIETAKERERLLEMSHTAPYTKHDSEVKHHGKAHKDHDHHHIQASISSMLHTVKDFFFGKSKKDSHDQVENKGRELDHSLPLKQPPPQPETPPSFRLQPEHDQAHKPLTEDVVPMETEQPKESSEIVDGEQQSVSLEMYEHKHEDGIPHTDLPPTHTLPPESKEESTGQSVKEADEAIEAMEVSVGLESSGPCEEMSLSGIQVLTEAVEIETQPEQQTARDESSPREDKFVLPPTQVPCEENYFPTSTLSGVEESWTPPSSVITLFGSPILGEQPTTTLQDEQMSVDKIGGKGAQGVESDHLREETECASLIQEVNVGFPPTAAPESVEKGDLKIHQECTSSIVEESTEAHGLSAIQSPPSDFRSSQETKEIAQLDDKTEMFKQEQSGVKSSEPLTHIDHASIPVINISCTDDKEDDIYVNTHVSDMLHHFETPLVPSFVVPPISVTCHESGSGLRLPTQTLIPKVGDNAPLFTKTSEDNKVPEILKTKPLKEATVENSVSVEELQRNRSSVERLYSKPPTHPSLSPASLRKFMSKAAPDSDNEAVTAVPVITVGDRQSDKADEDLSGGSTPTSSLSRESSPRLKRRDSLSLIRSATPEELACGARRKIFIPKPKEDGEGAVVGALDAQGKKETPYMSPSQARRAALLQASTGQNTPPMERRSPLLSRRKVTLEVPKVVEETPTEEPVSMKREEKPAEKKLDPLKAPQVIRKIRGEPFPDASGHLKLWCQFFNVLSDSTIKWYRDEEEILEVKRSGGDESQVALAIVQASSHDCGVYGCSITNEYGTDTTDFLLSVDILSEILLRDDLEVGEEIEMTPLLFSKGLADCGSWGEKYFGRIMTEMAHLGDGCTHKASRVKVIYGLDPIFESGSACIIKVRNPIAYGTKQESNLAERNLEITKQECKIQNLIREYCKIFAAEARVIENFGSSLEVIPQYLMYRPANSVPYATVEADLKGVYLKYCLMDPKGRLITRTTSEVEQKCSTFQHWIHQWTHGNLLVTQLEGVETKITNIRVVTKSKGYQGLTEVGSPEVFEQFSTHHHCNYFCGLLGLHPLKMDSLQQPGKMKGSRSPLLNRKLGSSSPQQQRKGQSPQMSRKANSSPKVTRKVQETEDIKSGTKRKPAEMADVLEMR
ncbi:hypothetical protein L3Q82_007268 [Scortum barcoo]|uniref:Uncharacterized protein n=1 Tax=Scortum barcoo TaxID=214431 RepID=A0ACB8WTE4_9TELE|nr:hypothetical protein L3Q82_007268 [Scortum barcoo]